MLISISISISISAAGEVQVLVSALLGGDTSVVGFRQLVIIHLA